MLLLVLVLLVLLAAGGGLYGSRRDWGFAGWSPLVLLAVVIVVLWMTGDL